MSSGDGHFFTSRGDEMPLVVSSGDEVLGFDPERTALVLVDMVNWNVHPDGACTAALRDAGAHESADYFGVRLDELVFPNLERLLPACRAAGVRPVYLRVGSYRADFSDAVPGFRSHFKAAGAVDGSWSCEVYDRLRPEPGEAALIKTGSGGFASSLLDSQLRLMGITDVLYCGVVTNGCVLLTVAHGFDLGYRGYMVADATATYSDRLQDYTEEIVGAYMAKIVTTEQLLAALDTAAAAAA